MELAELVVNAVVGLVAALGGALIGVGATKRQIAADNAKERRERVGASYDVLSTALDRLRDWIESTSPLRWERTDDPTRPRFLPPDAPPALPPDGRIHWSPDVRRAVGEIEAHVSLLYRDAVLYSQLGPMGPIDQPNPTQEQQLARRVSERMSPTKSQLLQSIEAVQARIVDEVAVGRG